VENTKNAIVASCNSLELVELTAVSELDKSFFIKLVINICNATSCNVVMFLASKETLLCVVC
jgi:hypothetical protein